MQAVLGFALAPAPAQTPPPAESTPAQPTPTPTLGDRFTQVLKDQHVVFRFFAPKANAVDVVIGIKRRSLRNSRNHDERDDERCGRPLPALIFIQRFIAGNQ